MKFEIIRRKHDFLEFTDSSHIIANHNTCQPNCSCSHSHKLLLWSCNLGHTYLLSQKLGTWKWWQWSVLTSASWVREHLWPVAQSGSFHNEPPVWPLAGPACVCYKTNAFCSKNKVEVKKSLCLTNYALHHEDVWGSGCIDPHVFCSTGLN
jgi:hypothetical protein